MEATIGVAPLDAHTVAVGSRDQALEFADPTGGWGPSTISVWFIHNEVLYELTAPGQDADLLNEILATWQFSK